MNPEIESKSVLLTKNQMAELCKISLSTLNRWMRNGKVSYLKLGRRVLFNQNQALKDLEKFKIEN